MLSVNDIKLVRIDTTCYHGTGCKTLGHGLEELGIQSRLAKSLNSFVSWMMYFGALNCEIFRPVWIVRDRSCMFLFDCCTIYDHRSSIDRSYSCLIVG